MFLYVKVKSIISDKEHILLEHSIWINVSYTAPLFFSSWDLEEFEFEKLVFISQVGVMCLQ